MGRKADKIKCSQIILDCKFGGAKLPHIQTQFDALKVGWLRRIIFGDQKWVRLFQTTTTLTKVNLLQFGLCKFITVKKMKNKFWYDVLHAWGTLTNLSITDPNIDFNLVARNYLWWNDKIVIGNKPVNYRHWQDKSIMFVNDLLNENEKKIFTMTELCDNMV